VRAAHRQVRRAWALAALEMVHADPDEAAPADPLDAPTGQLPLDQARTAALPVVASKLDRGCRTKLADGKRCGHATAAHQQVGFYAGERERCFCGCTAYRQPWFDFVLTAVAVGGFVLLLFLLLMAAS
jgi:hypothetical protein